MTRVWLQLGMVFALAVAAGAQTPYVVKSGDSLDSIARAHGISVPALLAANRIPNADILAVGQRIVIPPPAGTARTYKVEEGDTLGAIAQDHGVSVQRLLEANSMTDPDRLVVGQLLSIPQNIAIAAERHPLAADVKRRLDAIPVRTGRWRYVVIHHSATKEGSARSMDMYHRQKRRMENGLAYHFVIGNGRGTRDGAIEIGDRWRRQIKGGHLASDRLNEISIGICLVGDFNRSRPTAEQMKSLRALVSYLMRRSRVGTSAVKTHRQINTKPTECPGKNFPTTSLLQSL